MHLIFVHVLFFRAFGRPGIGRLLGLAVWRRAAPIVRDYPWEIFQKAYEL
jgi:hypothetical protein